MVKSFIDLVAPKGAVCVVYQGKTLLGSFATDSASQLYVFGHDGDTFGMDCAQVSVLE